MIGLLLAIINFEYDIYCMRHNAVLIENNPQARFHPRNTTMFAKVCRIVTALSTVLSIICLFMRHKYKLKWVNKYFSAEFRDPNHINFMYDEIINESQNEFGQRKRLFTKSFIFEVLVLMVCPIPYFE